MKEMRIIDLIVRWCRAAGPLAVSAQSDQLDEDGRERMTNVNTGSIVCRWWDISRAINVDKQRRGVLFTFFNHFSLATAEQSVLFVLSLFLSLAQRTAVRLRTRCLFFSRDLWRRALHFVGSDTTTCRCGCFFSRCLTVIYRRWSLISSLPNFQLNSLRNSLWNSVHLRFVVCIYLRLIAAAKWVFQPVL